MDAPLSVKRLLEQIKARIEPPFSAVCVVGEVSNFRGSGRHWYFTLKEEGAALSCAVWAGQQRFLARAPRNGERVVVKGSLNLYIAGGSLTLAVTHCEPAGAGDLQARLRELEAALRSEGVFDRPRRPLPRFPGRIGVVGALGGAALRDVLEVTRRRAPGIDILVHPAAAQGERCVPENLLALQEIQDPFWKCDVLLLVRGGGSLEDLWGYNDPALVRAIAGCRLPLVTGLGHEIDTTLADLAADRRAATPSQAAELATPDRQQLRSELLRRSAALLARMQWRLRGWETTLNLLADSAGMRAVPGRLAQADQSLSALRHRLGRCAPHHSAADRLGALARRLHFAHPQRRLDLAQARLALLRQRLAHLGPAVAGESDRPRVHEADRRLVPAVQQSLGARSRRLEILGARLRGLDPRRPLQQGFVLATDGEGRPVTSAQALPGGAPIGLQWLDGHRTARLENGGPD
ncbi:MAG TPA: exodeoxyribonuclease VII large subunit [Holophaga sp.]|nr:exodeoxyribonuclease VII large subunit [Holophaga sp.]